MLVGSGLRRRSPKEFEMNNEIPTVKIYCDGCGCFENVEMIQISPNEPRLYRIPFLWEFDWLEKDGEAYCQYCQDEGDTPSETLSAAERNPSLTK